MSIEQEVSQAGLTLDYQYHHSDRNYDYYQLVLLGNGVQYEIYIPRALDRLPKGSEPPTVERVLQQIGVISKIKPWIEYHQRQVGSNGGPIGRTIGIQPLLIPEALELRYLVSFKNGWREAIIILTGADGLPLPDGTNYKHIKKPQLGPYAIRLGMDGEDIPYIQGQLQVLNDPERYHYQYLAQLIQEVMAPVERELQTLANANGIGGAFHSYGDSLIYEHCEDPQSHTLRGHIVTYTDRDELEIKSILQGVGIAGPCRVKCLDSVVTPPEGCVWQYILPDPREVLEQRTVLAELQEEDNRQEPEGSLEENLGLPLRVWLQLHGGDGLDEPASTVGYEMVLKAQPPEVEEDPEVAMGKAKAIGEMTLGAEPPKEGPLPTANRVNEESKQQTLTVYGKG